MRDKPYCKAPWIGLSYTGTEGCQPCCEWKGDHFYGTHTEYLKSDYLKDFKKLMYKDEMHHNCIECIEKEKIDTHWGSRRQRFMKYDIDGGYVRLDFRAGDKCNMKCRMCGTGASSLWRDEDLEQGQNNYGQSIEHLKNLSIPLKNVYENKHIDTSDVYDIDFSKLTKIMILGGEPSIDLKVRRFINSVKDLDCPIGITTNASNASDKWFNTLKQIKRLELDLSIDATGKYQDYQRTGSDWSVIKKNVIKYRDTFKTDANNINVTATAMNFPVLHEWWDEMMSLDIQTFFSKCHHPEVMSLDVIPNEYKEYQIAWLKHWIDKEFERPRDRSATIQNAGRIASAKHAIGILKNSEYKPEWRERFIKHINYLDSIRGTNIRDLHGIFEEIMNEG